MTRPLAFKPFLVATLAATYLLMPPPVLSQEGVFQRTSETAVAELLARAYGLATGDLTADGNPDIVVSTSDGVYLITGMPGLQLQLARKVWPEGGASGIVLADFDRDGIPDVAVRQPDRVLVLKRTADGSFQALSSLPLISDSEVSPQPVGLVTGDWNRDGIPDLAAARPKSVAVFHGGSSGTFSLVADLPVGNLPSSLVTGDFNGDGLADLATTNRFSNDISILLGIPQGSFSSETRVPLGERPYAVATGDFNKDRRLDLVVGAFSALIVLAGKGDGTFTVEANIPQTDLPVSLATADLNDDEISDVVVGNYYNGKISVLLSRNGGQLQESSPIAVLGDIFGIAIADVNGDSRPDLIATSISSSALMIASGRGTGQFDTPVYFGAVRVEGENWMPIRTLNIRVNGKPELVVVGTAKKAISFLPGAAGPVRTIMLDDYPVDAQSADYTGDGTPDLAVLTVKVLRRFRDQSNEDSGATLLVLPGRNDGTLGAPVTTSVEAAFPSEWYAFPSLSSGDFTGDGFPDLAVVNPIAGAVRVYAGKRDGTLNLASTASVPTLSPVLAADFDGDNIQDLAVLQGRTGLLFHGRSGGQLVPWTTLNVCDGASEMRSGDFNGDGRMDFAVLCRTPLGLQILENSGEGAFRLGSMISLPLASLHNTLLTVSDYNADGKDDLVAVESRMGANNAGLLFLSGDDGTLRSRGILTGLEGPLAVVSGNWNNDTRPDLALLSGTKGTVTVLLNATGSDVPASLSAVSAASLVEGAVAPESIVSLFGQALSNATEAAGLPLPESIAGASVAVTGSDGRTRAAALLFVSPGQINLVVPSGIQPGTGILRVSRDGHVIAEGLVQISQFAPSLFTANADGKGVAAAVALRIKGDGSQISDLVFRCGQSTGSCVATPIDLGGTDRVYLLLFGTGIRGCPVPPAVTIGGLTATITGSAPQSQFAGLDQVNVELVRQLAGKGETELALEACGIAANRVTISIR